MSSNESRRIPSRTWLGVAAITLGVGTALTPTVAHAQPETPGNPSGSDSGGQSGSTSQPKPKSNTAEEKPKSTTAEENVNHHATTGKTECSKPEEECRKPGEMVGAGQDTVPAGLGNSTIVGGHQTAPAGEPVPTLGAGQDTVTPGLGNSTIVGG